MGKSSQANKLEFGVPKGKEFNPNYYKNKKIITYCGHDTKPIREGESYLITQDGVHLRNSKKTLIEYFNLHEVFEYDGTVNG